MSKWVSCLSESVCLSSGLTSSIEFRETSSLLLVGKRDRERVEGGELRLLYRLNSTILCITLSDSPAVARQPSLPVRQSICRQPFSIESDWSSITFS